MAGWQTLNLFLTPMDLCLSSQLFLISTFPFVILQTCHSVRYLPLLWSKCKNYLYSGDSNPRPFLSILKVSDAVLCPGMSKVIAASEQGRLFVFPAVLEASFDEDRLADEQVETKHIVIVAHEVCIHLKFLFISDIFVLLFCDVPRLTTFISLLHCLLLV